MPNVKKVKLITRSVTYGARHEPIYKDTATREVFAELFSAQQSEFFQASSAGFTAEGKASVWAFEYHNETVIQIGTQRYAIYRTYSPPGNKIELHYGFETGPNTSAAAPEVTQ